MKKMFYKLMLKFWKSKYNKTLTIFVRLNSEDKNYKKLDKKQWLQFLKVRIYEKLLEE